MNQAPVFHRSLLGSVFGSIEVSNWKIAVDAYQNKDYKASFYALLDYIDPQLRKKYGNADQTSFEVPHGSIVVNIKLIDDKIEINAPFLQLPGTSVIPVLRKLTELNFSPLNLSALRLKDENVEFYFQCSLSTCEPYKMYYVLKEICHTGDTYDDYFTVKHGAKRIHEPKITPYTAAQAEEAWVKTCSYIDEAIEYITYYDNKRWYKFSYDVAVIALFKIEYYACPQGNTRNELEDAIGYLYSHNSYIDITSSTKKALLKIKEKGKEVFLADFYQAEVFVPNKTMLSLANLQKNWEHAFQHMLTAVNNDNSYTSATLEMLHNFLYVFSYNTLPNDVHNFMTNALEKASGKDWKEAAQTLLSAMQSIMNGNLQAQATQTQQAAAPAPVAQSLASSLVGGLFSKLFGN